MKKAIYILVCLVSLLSIAFISGLHNSYTTEEISMDYKTEKYGKMEIIIPELQKGRAVILKLPTDEFALVDCGSADDFSGIYEIMRSYDIEFIDFIILTSDSYATSGGVENFMSIFNVGDVYISTHSKGEKRYKEIVNASICCNTNVNLSDEGSRIYDFEGMCIDVVSSKKCTLPDGKYSVLSIYITHGDNAVFVQGDGDFAMETEITQTMDGTLKSDIYVVPNCASGDTCGWKMIETVSPFYAAIPMYNDIDASDKTIDTLLSYDINVLRTDKCGDVTFVSDGENIKFNRQR